MLAELLAVRELLQEGRAPAPEWKGRRCESCGYRVICWRDTTIAPLPPRGRSHRVHCLAADAPSPTALVPPLVAALHRAVPSLRKPAGARPERLLAHLAALLPRLELRLALRLLPKDARRCLALRAGERAIPAHLIQARIDVHVCDDGHVCVPLCVWAVLSVGYSGHPDENGACQCPGPVSAVGYLVRYLTNRAGPRPSAAPRHVSPPRACAQGRARAGALPARLCKPRKRRACTWGHARAAVPERQAAAAGS